jgi:hypothetical protein
MTISTSSIGASFQKFFPPFPRGPQLPVSRQSTVGIGSAATVYNSFARYSTTKMGDSDVVVTSTLASGKFSLTKLLNCRATLFITVNSIKSDFFDFSDGKIYDFDN